MPGPKRGKIFFEAASIMRNRAEEAASLMVNEMGKPIREARGEIGRCIDLLEYYGGWGWRLGGQRLGSACENTNIYTMDSSGWACEHDNSVELSFGDTTLEDRACFDRGQFGSFETFFTGAWFCVIACRDIWSGAFAGWGC